MRTYSKRERVLVGLTVPLWVTVVAFAGFMIATRAEARTYIPQWLAGLGGAGATWIACKIAATGRSTRRLEQRALDALAGRPLPPDS
jgi:hypothetical protein